MKNRILSLLLALLLISTVIMVSCGEAGPSDGSGEPSETASDETSSEPGELRYTNVSAGKPYTLSGDPNEHYPDLFGQQLTDGQKTPDEGAVYTDVRMVGFTADTTIVVDLGDDGKRIDALSLRSLQYEGDGVGLALSVRFYGSEDGKDWDGLGRVFFASGTDRTVQEARLEPKDPVDYRFIRAKVSLRSGYAFYFLDELEVFADVPAKQAEDASLTLYAGEQPDRNAWKTLSAGKKVSYTRSENLARNKTYTVSGAEFDERAPASDTLLTDGDPTGRLFGEPVFVGMKGSPSVTVDLEKSYDNLYGFRLFCLGSGTGVALPGAVDVYASGDGKTYVFLGRAYAPERADSFAFTVLLPEYVSARYVRFTVSMGSAWCWAEEAEALGGFGDGSDELYAPVEFPAVTEDLFRDPSDPDYRKRQNLLAGLPQQVAVSFYMNRQEHSDETPADTTVLTDGKTAQNMYCYGGEWFFHRGGGAIDFFYDLGCLASLSEFRVSLLEQSEWGISRPRNITVLLSDDGNTWYPVDAYARDEEEGLEYHKSATRLPFTFTLKQNVAARFVRFRVESGFLFIDELEAFGAWEVGRDALRLKDSGITPSIYYTSPGSARYADPETTGVKAKDIALVFGEKGDENTLLPYVAYLDREGNIADTLMDGFLYCPTGRLPSGKAAHEGAVRTDWEFLFENTFHGVNGFDRLNEVVGQVKEALSLPDYRVQVYVTLLTLRDTVTDFGDADGDGVSEDLSTAEGRQTVLDWFIDKCESAFASGNYENLELDGYYWVSESVNWEKDDSGIISQAADVVHTHGSKLLWVPYYTAYRYEIGYELGFDLVCMQPNYVFEPSEPYYRLPTTASRTKALGMCVEIEHTTNAFGDPRYAKKYLQYLACGAETGYMDASHVYYDDLTNFASLAYSDSELARMQYDATYAFVKGTLETDPGKREQLCFYGKQGVPVTDTLRFGDEYATFTLVSPPSHGTVALAEDGSFRYFPDGDFTGEDHFSYTYNKFLGESEPCVVSVSVEPTDS